MSIKVPVANMLAEMSAKGLIGISQDDEGNFKISFTYKNRNGFTVTQKGATLYHTMCGIYKNHDLSNAEILKRGEKVFDNRLTSSTLED